MLVGVGVIILGIYLMVTNSHISFFTMVLPLGLGGLVVGMAGIMIITGERIRDILDLLLTGF